MRPRLSNDEKGQTSSERKKAMPSKVAPGMQWVRFIVADYSLRCAGGVNDVERTTEWVARSESGREGRYLGCVPIEL